MLHLNLAPFKCHICQETFGRADYLKKHLQSHVEDKEKKGGSKTTPGKFIRFKNTGKVKKNTGNFINIFLC